MIDATVLHVLASAKAYAALLGSLLSVLVVTVGPDTLPPWVGVALAVLTAFATWAVPNTPTDPPYQPQHSADGDLGSVA